METIQSITKNNEVTKWQKRDTVWMLSLFGTAIGAGILFLPIDAGIRGIIPLMVMLFLAYPLTHFSHLALCRFVLSGSQQNNITEVVDEHFGKAASRIISLLYFFSIYPILLLYSVAITNTTSNFLVNQLGTAEPPRALLALLLITALMFVIRFGQNTVVKCMSTLVYPFITILIALSIYLIPHWNGAVFQHATVASSSHNSLFATLWLLLPVLVFSFNHSPIISSFALSQKQHYGDLADAKSRRVLKYAHILMVITVMFFVFSCVLSLTPADLMEAKKQNITILSYLANHFANPTIAYIAPCIAFIAIAKSFFGHYLGASEGLGAIFNHLTATDMNGKRKILLIDLFMILTCWLVATINPNILNMIESFGGPIIAMILFLMPMYAIAKVPALTKYRAAVFSNLFTIGIGLVATSAIIYKLFISLH